MILGDRVEFQTDRGSFGIGVISKIDEETEIAVVIDEETGDPWVGPLDKCTLTD